MVEMLRMVFMGGTLGVVVLAAALQQPEARHELGLDQENGVALRCKRWFGLGSPHNEEDIRDRAIQQRIYAKGNITRELIAGHISLFEAATQFRHLSEEGPVSSYRPYVPGDSEEERWCQRVIQWVEAELYSSRGPEAAKAFVEQLNQELHQNKVQYGTVRFPEPATE